MLAPAKRPMGSRLKYEIPAYLPNDLDDDLIDWVLVAIRDSLSWDGQSSNVPLADAAYFDIEFAEEEEVVNGLNAEYCYDVRVTIRPKGLYTLDVDIFALADFLNVGWEDIDSFISVGPDLDDEGAVITPAYFELVYRTTAKDFAKVCCTILMSAMPDYGVEADGIPAADAVTPPAGEDDFSGFYDDDDDDDDVSSRFESMSLK